MDRFINRINQKYFIKLKTEFFEKNVTFNRINQKYSYKIEKNRNFSKRKSLSRSMIQTRGCGPSLRFLSPIFQSIPPFCTIRECHPLFWTSLFEWVIPLPIQTVVGSPKFFFRIPFLVRSSFETFRLVFLNGSSGRIFQPHYTSFPHLRFGNFQYTFSRTE